VVKFAWVAGALVLAVTVTLVSGDTPAKPGPIRFENIAAAAGIGFVLQNHATPEKRNIETMPGGVAVFDYNNDGRPDIFFTNGASVPGLKKESSKDYNRLYRNDGGLKFTDVTEQAGLAGIGYSNGVAAADYDNDGNVDLFVAGVFANRLYRNRGDGTFEDVSAKAGIRSDEWSAAAGWFDFDNDGLLDLIVVDYVKWDPAKELFCGDAGRHIRIYCHPTDYPGTTNHLYRNRGDGSFEDVSDRTGISRYVGRGMSVAFNDYDGDGWLDMVITNDNLPNFLFHNIGGKRFEEVGLNSGVALLDSGKAVSSMGVDFRDYDNDGRPDIAIAALAGETFPLFHNEGRGVFRDATYSSGLGRVSATHSGWCAGFIDFNNDGFKDLFASGGHVNDLIESFAPNRYKEANLVLLNAGNGQFRDVSESAGDAFAHSVHAHRGCGFADFDGDGLTDVVVTSLGEAAEVWHNTSPVKARYVDVLLRGTKSNRDGIGAQLRIGAQRQIRTSAIGYASSSHVPVHFGGIGPNASIEILWPSGKKQTVPMQSSNGVQVVVEPQ
jgi:hypothetical protein